MGINNKKVERGTKKLNSWLLGHYRQLSLKATQVRWIREWFPGYCDLQVSIVLDGKEHIGRGVAEDSDLAFTKAGAEALERAFCFEHNISTCGVAVHTDEQSARENARNELVERDRFFCHYLTETFFNKVGQDGYDDIRDKLKNHDVIMKIFEMNPLNQIKSFICLAKSEKTGLNLGLGASVEISVAMKKAVLECLINTVAALHKKVPSLSLGQFEKLPACQPEDHRRLYMGERELVEKNSWMLVEKEDEPRQEFLSEESFRYSRLYGRNELLRDSPVFAIKCENTFLQKSFYGNFKREHINFERIGKFAEAAEINRLPHPLG